MQTPEHLIEIKIAQKVLSQCKLHNTILKCDVVAAELAVQRLIFYLL
jgi:hypothetical protein